mmetsp:Transcript_167848/g.539081  ORF Transcript_167848/g.539081 Transcript_167848/m.539081 type:complete len:327 (-) Transcript_167848:185-1165(-)
MLRAENLPADGDRKEIPDEPLGFRAAVYQEVQLARAAVGRKHAGAVLASPVVLGIANGVESAQLTAADPSVFPRELLRECHRHSEARLLPGDETQGEQRQYLGPISLLQEAFMSTRSSGAAKVLLAAIDNTSRIHGVVRPMLGVISVGDSGLLLLRRGNDRRRTLDVVFCSDSQAQEEHPESLRRAPPAVGGSGRLRKSLHSQATIQFEAGRSMAPRMPSAAGLRRRASYGASRCVRPTSSCSPATPSSTRCRPQTSPQSATKRCRGARSWRAPRALARRRRRGCPRWTRRTRHSWRSPSASSSPRTPGRSLCSSRLARSPTTPPW